MNSGIDINKTFGGIEAKNIDDVQRKFICGNCKRILHRPWQFTCCGNLMCRWCAKFLISDTEPFVCPCCHSNNEDDKAVPDRGAERDLQSVVLVCLWCDWNGHYCDYIKHLENTHNNYKCMDCNQYFALINDFEEHRREICQKRRISCGLSNCTDLVIRENVLEHYHSKEHQYKLAELLNKYSKSQQHGIDNQENAETKKNELLDIQKNILILTESANEFTEQMKRLRAAEIQLAQKINDENTTINELKIEYSIIEKDKKKIYEMITSMKNDIEIMESCMRDPYLVVDSSSSVLLKFSYQNVQPFSLLSAYFKTSEYGYLFRLRVYATQREDVHYLSVSLTMYDSPYSNVLPYPFLYPMRIILCDQSYKQEHIGHDVKPNPNSPSFKRPITESNEEYDIEQFCLFEKLSNSQSPYVHDGIFFIRVFIDFLNPNIGEV